MKRVKIKTVLRSCQRRDTRGREPESEEGREGRQEDIEETGRKDRRHKRKAQTGFVLITSAGKAERFLLVRLSLWIKRYIYISD